MTEHKRGRHGPRYSHGPHGEERLRERGRRGRVFDAREFQILLLRLIGDEPRHGYELIREIETRSGGLYAPSPGMVYPTLSYLVEAGLIAEAATEGARKSFAITPAGQGHLDEYRENLTSVFARLDALAAKKDRADPAPLRRAMGNLRQVLLAAGEKGDFAEDKVLEAARLIDETAGRIERL